MTQPYLDGIPACVPLHHVACLLEMDEAAAFAEIADILLTTVEASKPNPIRFRLQERVYDGIFRIRRKHSSLLSRDLVIHFCQNTRHDTAVEIPELRQQTTFDKVASSLEKQERIPIVADVSEGIVTRLQDVVKDVIGHEQDVAVDLRHIVFWFDLLSHIEKNIDLIRNRLRAEASCLVVTFPDDEPGDEAMQQIDLDSCEGVVSVDIQVNRSDAFKADVP